MGELEDLNLNTDLSGAIYGIKATKKGGGSGATNYFCTRLQVRLNLKFTILLNSSLTRHTHSITKSFKYFAN